MSETAEKTVRTNPGVAAYHERRNMADSLRYDTVVVYDDGSCTICAKTSDGWATREGILAGRGSFTLPSVGEMVVISQGDELVIATVVSVERYAPNGSHPRPFKARPKTAVKGGK